MHVKANKCILLQSYDFLSFFSQYHKKFSTILWTQSVKSGITLECGDSVLPLLWDFL